MKKVWRFLGVLVMTLLFLGACSGGSSEETNTFTGETMGTDTTVAITHQDQTIKKVDLTSSFDLADLGYSDADVSDAEKETIEQTFASQFEEYNDAEGVTIESKFDEGIFSVNIVLVLENIDAETFNYLTGTANSSDISDLTYDDFVSELESSGLTEES